MFKKTKNQVLDEIEDLEIKLDEIKLEIKKSNDERVKRLEDMVTDSKARKMMEYGNAIRQKNDEIACNKELIDQLAKELSKVKNECKKAKDKIEDLEKALEKSKKENVELIERIKDLESDRYLKVEVPADKAKGNQKMSTKASKIKSRKGVVNKQLKEISENNLKEEVK